jgi:tRNA 5-methylaminomethyl-2-thiouridine biosynthesis bifunctional protein
MLQIIDLRERICKFTASRQYKIRTGFMNRTPRSAQFDDIYFTPDNGLEETRHVFLAGNNLPESWTGRDRFTIAETGFGTGLNFLETWTRFEQTAGDKAILDYVSFELYPLAAREILDALSHWSQEFGGRLERLVKFYPLRIPGWHRVDLGPRVRLTLVFDDVNMALPRLRAPAGIDAWFLDGFAPAKNPLMWTDVLFRSMARLSNPGSSVATFTAAGLVKRGLAQAGFTVEKIPGYGRKRDMISARYAGGQRKPSFPRPERIAIVGGGLAGTACASVLKSRGLNPVIFEAGQSLATGASGNMRGIFNPRFTARREADADFYMSGFELVARTLRHVEEIDFRGCGSLHLVTGDDKAKRFESCLHRWGWHEDHMALLPAAEASEKAGIALAQNALYLPDSGQLSPLKLCHHWAGGTDVRLSSAISPGRLDDFDAVILACGAAVRNFIPFLPVHTVRGQIIQALASSASAVLKTNICYGGYIGAAEDGGHIVGSTFQKWLDSTDTSDIDTRDILDHLDRAVPGLGLRAAGARASLRCAARDRFPVIGAVPGHDRLYVSTAHGSHGIVSSLAGAHMIADQLEGGVLSLPEDSVNLLSLQRFLDRAKRRGESVIE